MILVMIPGASFMEKSMEGDQKNQLSGVKEIADANKNYSIEQLLDTCLDTLIHL